MWYSECMDFPVQSGIPLRTADILLPKKGTDLKKWAVIACDQHTSDPAWWDRLEEKIGDAPSTLRLIYPEARLGTGNREEAERKIAGAMEQYLYSGLFETYKDSFVLVRRKSRQGRVRWGLVGTLDLEAYDGGKDSRSLIRATEGTIMSRIPPRMEIRRCAPLELPHVIVLYDDPEKTVLEPIEESASALPLLYDTDLAEDGEHVTGYLLQGSAAEKVFSGFGGLAEKADSRDSLLFAVGDGNHSVAAAKALWNEIKAGLGGEERKTHPARYCMVELENIHDPGIVFYPIHRIVTGISFDSFLDYAEECAGQGRLTDCRDLEELEKQVNDTSDGLLKFGCIEKGGYHLFTLTESPVAHTAAGCLEGVLDALSSAGAKVDYVHEIATVDRIGRGKDAVGIVLPPIEKSGFFQAILRDKAFPRKTFSMGEGNEKRYYMEARRITP